MVRLIAFVCCVCFFAAPAPAIVIVQEGDVYDELEVSDSEFLMTGGSVNRLTLGGITNAVIEGGVIGADNDSAGIVMLGSDHLTIRGGTIRNSRTFPNSGGIIASQQWNPVVTVEGTYFRVHDLGLTEGNQWDIEGWLTDGGFASFTYFHDLRASAATVEFNFVPGIIPQTPGDTDYDDIVDISDLNNVRNNFGSEGLGDSNQDGLVDIQDLNLVRNNFGRLPYFDLGPEYEVSHQGFVPEPPASITATVAVLALIVTAAKHRRNCTVRCC